jgi:hypothetical protein
MWERMKMAVRRFVNTYKPKPGRLEYIERLERRLDIAEARLTARLEAYGYAVDNAEDRNYRS